MRILPALSLALPLFAGVAELLGPGRIAVSRNQVLERGDGTGQFLELVLFPSPGVNGFSRVQTFTTRREAGRLTRFRLTDRELQIPEPQRIAREIYEFPLPAFSVAHAALAENRVVVLGGGTESTLRALNLNAGSVSRAIVLPAQARIPLLRPNTAEVWTVHAGTNNQISIADLQAERVTGGIQLRLSPQVQIIAFFFSASARTAYVIARNVDTPNDRGSVLLVDVNSRQIRQTISLGTTTPASAVPAPDGNTIYIFGTSLNDLNTAEPSLSYFDTFSGTVSVAATGFTQTPEQIAIHPNGTRLYFLQPQVTAMDEFDTQSRRVVRRIPLPRASTPANIEVTHTGHILSIRDGAGQQAVYLDSETGEILDTQAIPMGPAAMLLRP
jgi:hypothetical protein